MELITSPHRDAPDDFYEALIDAHRDLPTEASHALNARLEQLIRTPGILSASFALAIEMGARLEDLAGTIHAHPTRSEAVQEAALKALGHALHI